MNLIIKLKWDPDVFHFPEHFLIDFLGKKKKVTLSQFSSSSFVNNSVRKMSLTVL